MRGIIGSYYSLEPIFNAYCTYLNIVGYVPQTGIDAVKYEAWISELLQKQGGKITRDHVVE